jgi:hypothetical protein
MTITYTLAPHEPKRISPGINQAGKSLRKKYDLNKAKKEDNRIKKFNRDT